MMAWLTDPNIWASLLTLTALEIVLGIDNILFLSVVTQKLPEHQRPLARRIGLIGALVMRLVLLSAVVWITRLTQPIADIGGFMLSWRDVILIGGGLFLLVNGTLEIHKEVDDEEEDEPSIGVKSVFAMAIVQIMILDIVFSLNSVITAIGMTDDLPVMITAVIIAVAVMLFAAGPVSEFIERNPTTKMLALSFLLLVGIALIADGLHFHIPRGYLYFAIVFSVIVEALNLLRLAGRKRRRARRLAKARAAAGPEAA